MDNDSKKQIGIFGRIEYLLKKIIHFLTHEIWDIGDRNLSRTKVLLFNLLKKIILSVRGFTKSELMVKSTSLSFRTVLALVPVLAIIIAVGRGFGISERVNTAITEALRGQNELVPYITRFIDNYLEQMSGGVVIGIGIVFLLWTVISTFQEIEESFNKIWNVEKSRSFFHQFTTYIALIVVVPILISLASGFSIYINSRMNSVLGDFYSPLNNFFVRVLPFFFYWLLFTLLYFVVPNTKVKFIHALFAGIICGTIFQLFQYLYVNGQINLSRYNTVYGTFAAIPLFFFWLQISWLIVLYGAELSFVSQNLKDKYYEYEKESTSRRFMDFVLILVSKIIIKRFEEGLPSVSAEYMANQSNLPIRMVNDAIKKLLQIGIIVEIIDEKNNHTYMPAMDINKISVAMILSRIENTGKENYGLKLDSHYSQMWAQVKVLKEKTVATSKEILVKDL